ncbi:MAG: hypothetical protein BWY68_00542 [bacterium ADurb.Bin400]|nr:MAG: hypothetical protein BWY68_00542 [bacterium ADurb.Bin400]
MIHEPISPLSHILTLPRGTEIVSSIIEYCSSHKISSAWISGLGSVEKATLALYDLNEKQYFRQEFKGVREIANLTGNVGLLEGKVVTHIHAILADQSFSAIGGHLDQGIVGATCEIIITPLSQPIVREHDNKIGLNLIKP